MNLYWFEFEGAFAAGAALVAAPNCQKAEELLSQEVTDQYNHGTISTRDLKTTICKVVAVMTNRVEAEVLNIKVVEE